MNQLGNNDAITLDLSACDGQGDQGLQPDSQPTQAALVTGDLESQDGLLEQGTIGSLSIQGQGGVHSALSQQQGAAIIPDPGLGILGTLRIVGLEAPPPGHTNQQPEQNGGMLRYIFGQILGPNESNLIWRLILIAAFNFVAAAMMGVLFLPANLEGVHTIYWRVMLIMTVGVPIVVAVITVLVSFWLASDPEGWSNWITGLSVANVSMLAGPLVVYWVLTGATGN